MLCSNCASHRQQRQYCQTALCTHSYARAREQVSERVVRSVMLQQRRLASSKHGRAPAVAPRHRQALMLLDSAPDLTAVVNAQVDQHLHHARARVCACVCARPCVGRGWASRTEKKNGRERARRRA